MTAVILNPVTVVNSVDNPIPVTITALENVDAQTGTTYTIATADVGKLVTISNGSAVAVTLPQATTSGYGAGFWFDIVNLGAGAVTITPTTSTIQGASTLVLKTGSGARIVSDGTNYFVQPGSRTFIAGQTIKTGVATATLSSNAVTVTSYFTQITTEALTTAAGASQALVITLTGAAATDICLLTKAGGTNTRKNFQLEAVMTTNTCTITLYNTEPTNAINGTVIFNLWIMKA